MGDWDNTRTIMSSSPRIEPGKLCFALFLIALFAFVGFQKLNFNASLNFLRSSKMGYSIQSAESPDEAAIVPEQLLKLGVYTQSDLKNEAGVAPAFWGCVNSTNCDVNSSSPAKVYGPCFLPSHRSRIDWAHEVRLNGEKSPRYHNTSTFAAAGVNDLAGYCRPGFIIIGVGKGGTR